MPTKKLEAFSGEMLVLDMLTVTGILPSKGEARRLVQQNGLSINDVKITDINAKITDDDFNDGFLIVKKGKKSFYKVEK